MMSWVSMIATVSQWILLYPITYLIFYGYRMLRLLATPLVTLGQLALRGALVPFNLILKFEAFLSFVSTAILTGIVLGFILYYTTSLTVEVLNQSLGLSVTLQSRQPQDYEIRSIKVHKREKALKRSYNPPRDYLAGRSSKQNRRGGLLSSTILEEEKSNQGSKRDLCD
ncbi:hypothetical protein BDV28DRAFT_105358 [Aspergillus coremiiformis]|uniref:Uncharacterized protein n=1 Tax=Aspergillus coremiiformis TaxID=138285 RepID=A0A5N6Z797_9EURO|nr:hypothetical protein BDV28DRAFT_105358 [Aspergillus coremiiformis]